MVSSERELVTHFNSQDIRQGFEREWLRQYIEFPFLHVGHGFDVTGCEKDAKIGIAS